MNGFMWENNARARCYDEVNGLVDSWNPRRVSPRSDFDVVASHDHVRGTTEKCDALDESGATIRRMRRGSRV